jgi:hypothetical protein
MEMMDHQHARELLRAGKAIPLEERQSLEAHLEACSACRDYAAFLSRLERELPSSLPGVAFSQAELSRVSSVIAAKMRRGPMRAHSFESFKLAAWGAAAVLLVLVLSWGIQNLMPQQPLPVGLAEQTGTPSPGSEEAAEQGEPSLSNTPPPTDPSVTIRPLPTETLFFPSAQDLSLTTADLGPGWQLDAEVTDLDERYFMERGEDGRAIIWTEQKGYPLWFDLESVKTVSMRGFSQPEEKLVLFQVVAVFEDVQAEALNQSSPQCDPPCEHRNEYSDGSGNITYYREIIIGDESTAGIITDIVDPHPPFFSYIDFRKGQVLVTLFSVAQWDDPANAPPVDEDRLEEYARVIEANIASAFISSPEEIIEPSSTISAQEIGLNTADLGEGWTLDTEISDLNASYRLERGENGKAIIETLSNQTQPMFDPDLVESVSWRGFSQQEQDLVLHQIVVVFKDAALAEESVSVKGVMPDCTPPCEHVTQYDEGSGTRTIYENFDIGIEGVIVKVLVLEFDDQNSGTYVQFRQGKVFVILASLGQWDYENNSIVGSIMSDENLEILARIIEARIPPPDPDDAPEAFEPIQTPSPRPEPRPVRIEPSLTGEHLSLAGWSPDGQWLVFWTVEPLEQGATGFIEFVYRLGLYHPETGERCRYDEVTTTGYAWMLDWHPDGRWGFQQDDRFLAALPCEDPAPTDSEGFLTSAVPDLSLSPDGRYQALTVLAAEGRVQYLETSIIDLETGEAVELLHDGRTYTSLPWRIDLPVLYENFLYRSGEWLTDSIFLINHTYDQGPLLLSPGEQVVLVSPELFGEPPGYQDAEGYSRRASGSSHPDGENFHLLLRTTDREIERLFLKLYHSETGVVEELPYRHAWAGGIFQGYLFLNPRETVQGYETNGIWVRQVDPPGSEGALLASNIHRFQVSPELDRLVYSDDRRRLTMVSFPDGEIIRTWETSRYESGWIYWSPDGRRIATSGQAQGSQEVGIFVIELD